MKLIIRRFLHDIIAEVLGLKMNEVIWSNQNGVKQKVPFVVLKAYSHQGEAMEEKIPTGTPGLIDVKVPTKFILEVRYFGGNNSYPVDILDDMVRCFEKPSVVDKCYSNGVAFLYAEPVIDITTLLSNNQQFEPAAAVDFHCRFTNSVTDDVSYIDTVDIKGGTDGKLIYGKIGADGTVTDVAHAVPIKIYASAT